MSKARFDTHIDGPGDLCRALQLLNEALEIVDTLGRPEIGARLQHVVDSILELKQRNFAA